MFEERVSELGNAALGIEPFKLPSGEQLLVELVSFSIPGMANVAIGTGMSAIDMANQIEPMPSHILPNEQPKANITPEVESQLKSLGYTPDIIKDLDQAEVDSIIKNQTRWQFAVEPTASAVTPTT